jgi:signal peptidase II
MGAIPRPVVLLAIFVVDRLTKQWAVGWLMPRTSVELLPFFHLTYVENTGAAFGIGHSRNRFFIILSTLLIGFLFYLQRTWKTKNAWIQMGLLLVAGGALGNLYDRLVYGFVIDFMDFRVWPVFNVADSCVTVGAGCLAWGMRLEDLQRARRAA